MIVETKVNKNATAVKTNLTIIADDDQVRDALAQSAAIVRWQAHARKNGIPAAAVLRYSELKAGLRVEPMTAEAIKQRAMSDPAFKAELMKSLGL